MFSLPLPPVVLVLQPPLCGTRSHLAFATLPLHIRSVAFLKLTASSRFLAPPSSSSKSLRFSLWLTLWTLNINLLTYLHQQQEREERITNPDTEWATYCSRLHVSAWRQKLIGWSMTIMTSRRLIVSAVLRSSYMTVWTIRHAKLTLTQVIIRRHVRGHWRLRRIWLFTVFKAHALHTSTLANINATRYLVRTATKRILRRQAEQLESDYRNTGTARSFTTWC